MGAIRRSALLAAGLAAAACHHGVQGPDLAFEPSIARPAYPPESGPVVLVDEGHGNFHTVDGRYAPFAKLLRRDGYRVRAHAGRVSAESLAGARVYVVANALAASDQRGWKLPIEPAFAAAEVDAVRGWVEGGGSLLLIADHMPFPGAVEELAAAFDVFFMNGFLYDAEGESKLEFRRGAGLADHAITEGRDEGERVSAVRSFTGQAFRAGREVEPLLTVPAGSRLRLPVKAWKFRETTPSIAADGLLQGAVFRVGEGRVAVFGEAAMFSAQERVGRGERVLMGMNRPDAEENPRFLLNLIHWLTGLLDGPAPGAFYPSAAAAPAPPRSEKNARNAPPKRHQ